MRAPRIAVTAAGFAAAYVAYHVQVDNLKAFHATTEGRSLAIVLIGLAFVAAGAIAWSPRDANRIGPLMIATGFLLFARQIRYSHHDEAFTLFFWLGDVGYAMAGHVALAYPTGRLRDKYELWLVRVGYTATLVFPLLVLIFYDGGRRLHQFADPRTSSIVISGNSDLAVTLQEVFVAFFYGLLAALFVTLIIRKLLRATARGRRLLAPLLLVAVVAALRAVLECIFTFVDRPPAIAYNDLFWWQVIGFIGVPIALVDGLLRARLAHAGVGDLMVELERTPPNRLGPALARALRDDTLEIAFWLPDRRTYVDAAGHPVVLPDSSSRAVTKLGDEGEPVAALMHDPSLLNDRTLIDAAAAAARLSLENARLHAETRAQLAEVQQSRARIVTAADEERRRIERDIHDGAQQRLVALGLQLRSAQRRLGLAADPELERLLDSSVRELQTAVDELRELARGVHPAILTEEGLGAALESLTARTPVSVTLETFEERLPQPVEATAYFVACEALANVAKHADASRATLVARRRDGTVDVIVEDDGSGGAEPDNGSGLRGLADRVEALGGTFRVESPAGGGTRVYASIPCAS